MSSEHGPVVGIDLGGTNMQIGVVGADGTILGRCKRKTKAELGFEAVVERLEEGVGRACEDADLKLSSIEALGIGVPGALDLASGTVLDAPNLRWYDAPVRDALAGRLRVPVVVDNDVNVAVWGEYKRGAARGQSDTLGVWVGTGVGGGLVIGDRIFHGPVGTAGELGQTWITPTGSPDGKTVEDHASRTGMADTMRRLLGHHPNSVLHGLMKENGGRIGSKEVAAAFRADDALTLEVVDHAAGLLGVAIANVVTLLSINSVVLGGGITEALGQEFATVVSRHFARAVFPDRLRTCRIVPTALLDMAGVHGAALLAAEAIRPADAVRP